ncbi:MULTISPECIES: LysR family transcriptional regulator [Vibrio]|uniref:Transcriptional regulator n=1 Tax=Vibrio genomosp. F6 str. FF-238 TaxID=1191298 RepID=A0A1E5CUS3_9VIBR|nr:MULTISPECIES: LysR family transcriptional regulator [Vibrio]NOH85856.1 LysR family transcriptional regulator [Vibrio sp. 03-59-1]OEE73655.1 transcriptional regulator [Vibrio genomosp. F6 str. FF-238]
MLLEGIETLLVLSKEKTMSRTGSVLYLSQSAVSKRIAKLEKRLGKKLIEPYGRYVVLTADAKTLIENISPTFSELCGLIYEQQQVLADNTQLRIDCSETLVSGYFSFALTRCFRDDPNLTITTNHTPRIVENVKSGKAFLGLCAGYLPSGHGLLSIHLFDEPFYIVSSVPLKELPEMLIATDLTNSANTYQSAILEELKIRPVLELDSYTAAAHLALQGAAAALVPLSVVKALSIEERHLYMYDELSPLYRPIYICVRQNNFRLERIKKVINAISEVSL